MGLDEPSVFFKIQIPDNPADHARIAKTAPADSGGSSFHIDDFIDGIAGSVFPDDLLGRLFPVLVSSDNDINIAFI